MTEIGQVYGLNNQVRSAGTAKNGKALTAPAQLRPLQSTGTPRQTRLPVEDAVREVARGVTDYIVTNRLTRDEGYQAFKAELISSIPLTLLSSNEMEAYREALPRLAGQGGNESAKQSPSIATTEPAPAICCSDR